MYDLVLSLHSIVRWIALIAGIVAVVRAFMGWFGNRSWVQLDDRLGLIFTSVMDLQLLLGLLLYFFLSPLTKAALQNFGAAMSDSTLRYFAVEHILIMIIAVVLAHVGRSMAGKAQEPVKKHQRAALWFGLSVLLMLLAIPWPFLAAGAGRPWIRIG